MTKEKQVVINPLMQKIKLPGKIFQLPSRGMFYKNDELAPNVKNGEIHVHAMSTIDEINMKNPDMLFSGNAFDEVCRTCIPDILKPRELMARDVDAIMIFLRMVTYGNYFEIEVKHTCKEAKNQTYTLNLEKIIEAMVYLDPTQSDEIYLVKMPNDQVARLQPAKYAHVIELLQSNESKKEFTPTDIQENIVSNLANLIHDVDEDEDSDDIKQWLRAIPVTYVNHLAKNVERLNKWGPDVMTDIVCLDCKEGMRVEIPLNPMNFFSE